MAAYIISYFFELGYSSFFNIPNSLISIDLKLSFFPISITFFTLFLIYFYIFRFSTEITLSEAIEGLEIATIWTISGIIFSRIVLIIRILDIAESPLKIHYNSIVLIVSGIALVVLYYEYRVRFLKKYAPIYERIDPILLTLSRYFKFIKVRIKRNRGSIEQILLIHVIAQILILIFFVYSVGVMFPSLKNHFLVFKHNKEKLVVLKKYSDILICAPFDKDKKKIPQRFYFIKFNEQQNTRFEVKKIGPLMIQSEK